MNITITLNGEISDEKLAALVIALTGDVATPNAVTVKEKAKGASTSRTVDPSGQIVEPPAPALVKEKPAAAEKEEPSPTFTFEQIRKAGIDKSSQSATLKTEVKQIISDLGADKLSDLKDQPDTWPVFMDLLKKL